MLQCKRSFVFFVYRKFDGNIVKEEKVLFLLTTQNKWKVVLGHVSSTFVGIIVKHRALSVSGLSTDRWLRRIISLQLVCFLVKKTKNYQVTTDLVTPSQSQSTLLFLPVPVTWSRWNERTKLGGALTWDFTVIHFSDSRFGVRKAVAYFQHNSEMFQMVDIAGINSVGHLRNYKDVSNLATAAEKQ